MYTFESKGFEIAFDDDGEGDPIILLHGFAADRRTNWKLTGWSKLLQKAGFRVIAPDARGHGRSDKPTDPGDYAPEGIAGDVIRLMDCLEIDTADLFGYSMGGRNAGWLLAKKWRRFNSVVIGGTGLNLLKVDDPKKWTGRGFKLTADNKKTDSLAIPLAETIPGAKAVVVPGRSHLSCITDDFFKGAVMGFLGYR